MPILRPMEKKNSISVLFFKYLPTQRFRNFLRIENRTFINRDTATFVSEVQKTKCFLNANIKIRVCFCFFIPTDRLGISVRA